MSYVSENSAEVRDLSASEIELVGGGLTPSLFAAIKEQMGLGGLIRAAAKKVLAAAERQ